jgi:hypothetical protein
MGAAISALLSGESLFAGETLQVTGTPAGEDIFVAARRAAGCANGSAGVVIVGPDGPFLKFSPPPTSRNLAEALRKLPPVIPPGRSWNVAVIGDTGFAALSPERIPTPVEAVRAIPFLGFLIGWSAVGNHIWVFDGHASELSDGLAASDYLLVDSVMLSQLPARWMAVAQRSMNPGGKVLLHDREKQRIFPIAASNRSCGWRVTEPDGEVSYVHCLLTTLGREPQAQTVTIDPALPLPNLAALTADPDQLDWIVGLPFQYDRLNSATVVEYLLSAARKAGQHAWQKEWTLTTKLVSADRPPRLQEFACRRERKWMRTVLHITRHA